jgi:hypothetical protein
VKFLRSISCIVVSPGRTAALSEETREPFSAAPASHQNDV